MRKNMSNPAAYRILGGSTPVWFFGQVFNKEQRKLNRESADQIVITCFLMKRASKTLIEILFLFGWSFL